MYSYVMSASPSSHQLADRDAARHVRLSVTSNPAALAASTAILPSTSCSVKFFDVTVMRAPSGRSSIALDRSRATGRDEGRRGLQAAAGQDEGGRRAGDDRRGTEARAE